VRYSTSETKTWGEATFTYILLSLECLHRVLNILLRPPSEDFGVDGLDGEIAAKDRVRPLEGGPEEAVTENELGPDRFDVRDRNHHRLVIWVLNGFAQSVTILLVRV
jgi:hypothetical protein